MKPPANMPDTVGRISRALRHLLLFTLLMSNAVFGHSGDSGRALLAGQQPLPTQVDLLTVDHVALVAQQDILRSAKRVLQDDADDAPWLPSATPAVLLPVTVFPLSADHAFLFVHSGSTNSHSPRAPPALS